MTRDADLALSLVRGDALLSPTASPRLVSRGGARCRAGARSALALFTWLPFAPSALLAGRALPGDAGEPLFQHFGVQVRCLVAIPLFVLAEGRRARPDHPAAPALRALGPRPRGGAAALPRGPGRRGESPRSHAALDPDSRRRARRPDPRRLGASRAALDRGTPRRRRASASAAGGSPGSRGRSSSRCCSAGSGGWSCSACSSAASPGSTSARFPPIPTAPPASASSSRCRSCSPRWCSGSPAVFASRSAHNVLYHGAQVQSLRGQMVAVIALALLLFLAPLLLWLARSRPPNGVRCSITPRWSANTAGWCASAGSCAGRSPTLRCSRPPRSVPWPTRSRSTIRCTSCASPPIGLASALPIALSAARSRSFPCSPSRSRSRDLLMKLLKTLA